MLIFNITLVVLFFILKAVSDKILFHFDKSIFVRLPHKYHDFWDVKDSWDNKWMNGDVDQGERFPGSSTIFVMFTDMWHLTKFLQYVIIALILILNAVPIIHPVVDFWIYLGGGLAVFELFWSKILSN